MTEKNNLSISTEKSSEKVAQEKEKKIMKAEEFKRMISEKAEKHTDYVEFYKDAMGGYLDFLAEGGWVEDIYAPGFIFKEAYKKGADTDEDREFIEDFCKLIQKGRDIQEKLRKAGLSEGPNGNFDINELDLKYKINRDSKESYIAEKLKISEETANLVKDRLAYEQYYKPQFEDMIMNYYKKNKHFNIKKRISEITKKLYKLSYYPGELVPKMKEIEEKTGLGAIENHINYAAGIVLINQLYLSCGSVKFKLLGEIKSGKIRFNNFKEEGLKEMKKIKDIFEK